MDGPVLVGVTGHRQIRAGDIPALRGRVREVLRELMEQRPGAELVMLSPLAIGTDTLCAQEALSLGMRLICPLPLPVEEYRRDFEEADAAVFDALLGQASEVFPVPVPEGADRDGCYREVGVYIAEHSQVFLALWDGGPGKPGGCGAADIVDYVLAGGGAVTHIFTPRAGSPVCTDHPVRVIKGPAGPGR